MAQHLKIMNKRMVLLNPVSIFFINLNDKYLILFIQKFIAKQDGDDGPNDEQEGLAEGAEADQTEVVDAADAQGEDPEAADE